MCYNCHILGLVYMKLIYNNKLYIEREDILAMGVDPYLWNVLMDSDVIADFIEISDIPAIMQYNSIDFILDYDEVKFLDLKALETVIKKVVGSVSRETVKCLSNTFNAYGFDPNNLLKLRHMYESLVKFRDEREIYVDRIHTIYRINEKEKLIKEYLIK